MNFIKEKCDNDIIYNSIQMRINFLETGNFSCDKNYLISLGTLEATRQIKDLNDEQFDTILNLTRIKREHINEPVK